MTRKIGVLEIRALKKNRYFVCAILTLMYLWLFKGPPALEKLIGIHER
jgi:hypothetical protein